MTLGRKPIPKPIALATTPIGAMPRCPNHLSPAARREWMRIGPPLHKAGLLTLADRAALAAYCQAWGRWVEAEEKLAESPNLLKAPSGYVQQSPWLSIVNKQLELMGRYMAELGLTPAARTRLQIASPAERRGEVQLIRRIVVPSGESSVRDDLARRLARVADRGPDMPE